MIWELILLILKNIVRKFLKIQGLLSYKYVFFSKKIITNFGKLHVHTVQEIYLLLLLFIIIVCEWKNFQFIRMKIQSNFPNREIKNNFAFNIKYIELLDASVKI